MYMQLQLLALVKNVNAQAAYPHLLLRLGGTSCGVGGSNPGKTE